MASSWTLFCGETGVRHSSTSECLHCGAAPPQIVDLTDSSPIAPCTPPLPPVRAAVQISQRFSTYPRTSEDPQRTGRQPVSIRGRSSIFNHNPSSYKAVVGFYLLESGDIEETTLRELEQVKTRIPRRTIESLDNFIQQDLLPSSLRFVRQHGDIFRLATHIQKKSPVYLSQTADQRQAVEDLLQNWFDSRTNGPEKEYQICLIIERQSYKDQKIKSEPLEDEKLPSIKKESKKKIKVKKEKGNVRDESELSSVQSPSVRAVQKRRLPSDASDNNPHRTRRSHRLDEEDKQRINEYGPGFPDL